MSAKQPPDIQRGEVLRAQWLNDAKNSQPANIRGGNGINCKRMGRDLIIELATSNTPRERPSLVQFSAIITGQSVITTGVRWLYDIEEAEETPTFSSGTPTGLSFSALSGGRTGKAFNLAEWGNNSEPGAATPWYLADVDAHGEDYPDTYALMPIGGGGTDQTHKVNRVVWVTQRITANGDTYYIFDRQNHHDGTCE